MFPAASQPYRSLPLSSREIGAPHFVTPSAPLCPHSPPQGGVVSVRSSTVLAGKNKKQERKTSQGRCQQGTQPAGVRRHPTSLHPNLQLADQPALEPRRRAASAKRLRQNRLSGKKTNPPSPWSAAKREKREKRPHCRAPSFAPDSTV